MAGADEAFLLENSVVNVDISKKILMAHPFTGVLLLCFYSFFCYTNISLDKIRCFINGDVGVKPYQLDLGDISITWLNGGEFSLDGGTMFGAVPKVLWSRKYPPDADNYIKMIAAPLLIRSTRANVLIDTGLGNKLTEKQKQIYRLSRPWRVITDLSDINLTPHDIDVVILTHCDFDHAGGIIRLNADGQPEITFPNATHIINKLEWQDLRHPNSRSAHTYFPDNFSGLDQTDKLLLIDSIYEVIPGITVYHTGGHTRGHQIVEIKGKTDCALHLGDLMPTHAHANPLWIMAYDNYPLDVIAQKERLITQYRNQNCWYTFYHDNFIKAGKMDDHGAIH